MTSDSPKRWLRHGLLSAKSPVDIGLTIGLLIRHSAQIGHFLACGEIRQEQENSCKSGGLARFPSEGQMARLGVVRHMRRGYWRDFGYVGRLA